MTICATYHSSPENMRQMMHNIVEIYYPKLFSACQDLVAVAETFENNDVLITARRVVDNIYSLSERLYYKEKLILFPHLENLLDSKEQQKCVSSMNISVDETSRIAKIVESFKLHLLESKNELEPEIEESLRLAFKKLESAWWKVSVSKQQFYQHYTDNSQSIA